VSTVYISYRRQTASGEARTLFNDLQAQLGKNAVFMDDEGKTGSKLRKARHKRAIASCDIMLVIIDKDWAAAKDESGRVRLQNVDDVVRMEIEAGLKRDILVTPILVQGAYMPSSEDLPGTIRDLAYRNGCELSHNRWESDVREMIRLLGLDDLEQRKQVAIRRRPVALEDVGRATSKVVCFLSYSRRDGAFYADKLANILRDHGITAKLDMDALNSGENFIDTIKNSLIDANVLILIGTPAALQSEHVRTEIEFFCLHNKLILPIAFVETSADHIPISLRDIQWLHEDQSAFYHGPSDYAQATLLAALTRVAKFESHISTKPLPQGEVTRPTKVGDTPDAAYQGRPDRATRRTRHPSIDDKRPLNEAKLIIVGMGGVGKTSLVRTLAGDTFRAEESKTQGITITRWPLRCSSGNVRFNVWDFGGQEIMHATHQFFLTERSLYLLVLNGREGAEDINAEYWLKHIESFGGASPVIIVQNKINEHPFELNYRGLQGRYPQIRGFVKTDCKDAIGIKDLRELIKRVVVSMPEVYITFPLSWFRVKDRLESMKRDFMGYDAFCQLCDEEEIVDDEDCTTLCWALHCLGIALNYRDDSRLRETSVLKPEWVTQGIYKVLNASKLAERQGELHLRDLHEMLPNDRYPVVKHHFLLELMRKFSLCFPFSDEPDRYLVPELLGKEEPEAVREFAPADCLNFEYQYGVLPEGLIPRFMVRSHTLSHGQARWRSGVILAHEECKALIFAEPLGGKIIVRVMGGTSEGRRRLLAIVRYDLDKINAEFKDRFVAEPKVPLVGFPEFSVDYKKLVALEKEGVKEFVEYVCGRLERVSVAELLNGVDLETKQRNRPEGIVNPIAIFFSYSHKDEVLRDELETHLKLLQRQAVISTWHDRKIPSGKEWGGEIDRHLERAKIILLLISADFIASEYCWGNEVTVALQRHESGEAIVVPIMLRPCDWRGAPFSKLQGLPKEMRPVTVWENRDAAWKDVAVGIREMAEAASPTGVLR
jgi:internalin A